MFLQKMFVDVEAKNDFMLNVCSTELNSEVRINVLKGKLHIFHIKKYNANFVILYFLKA